MSDKPLPGPPRESAVRARAEELLTALAGPEARLRDDQWSAIEALVEDRHRALVVQRTGWGKSAVYFIAARLLREAGSGPTVIVSPLLALMRNQVEAAATAGVRAATINSANITEWQDVQRSITNGEVDVLLVSPERLNNPDFRDSVLPSLAANAGLVVVDEAHCVSDWGHDFRPDYRRIRSLVEELPAGVPVLATTATANDRVVRDVAAQLGVGGSSAGTLVLRGGLDRESLHLSVVDIPDAKRRLAWLVEHLGSLPGSGIIYCLTVSAAEDVASLLADSGHQVCAYTGRTESSEREELEQALLGNRVKALSATSALGMGFDKPDLGYVVHLGAPPSPISYYQQIGRAGRAADRAEVILLPGAEDRAVWKHFASLTFPSESVVREVLAALDTDRPRSTPVLESAVDVGRSRLEMVLKVLDVDGAVRRVKGGWVATGTPWNYEAERYAGLEQARQLEQQAMLEFESTTECRMDFLRRQLDDPTLDSTSAGCGRCDNCTGQRRSSDVGAGAVSKAAAQLGSPEVVLQPRRLWPTGLDRLGIAAQGKISVGPTAGRALARLTDLGVGQRLRILLDAPPPDASKELLRLAIPVLKEWQWTSRPTAVVALCTSGAASQRGNLIREFAMEIAKAGRMDFLGACERDRNLPPVTAHNSAYRVAALWGSFIVPSVSAGAVVLMVTDVVDTGWSLTIAAQSVREAGAADVLPLAIASAG